MHTTAATFTGTIGSGNINISDGTPVLTLTDTSSSATVTHTLDGVNYQIANNGSSGNFKLSRKVSTTERVFLHAHDNGSVYLYGTGTLAQTITLADTTFAGQISATAGGFNTAANVNSTGDKGIAIHSGARLGFDQSGTRSWSMKADGGNLNIFSGDTNGGLNVALADGVITNAIKTRSGDLDIYTVLTSRDMRFRSGNNTVQLRVKGDNSGIQIHDIASLRAASVTSATTTTVVASISASTYAAVFFDYVAYKSSNIRAGIVTACSDGTNVSFSETSTTDLGDTSDVTLSVDISGGNFRLLATTTSSTWNIKSLIRAI